MKATLRTDRLSIEGKFCMMLFAAINTNIAYHGRLDHQNQSAYRFTFLNLN